MRRRQALTIAASGAALLSIVGASPAATSGGWRIVARASSLTGPAGTAEIGTVRVRHPHALAIRVFAPPQRSMVADWIIVCSPSRKIVGHFRWRSTSAPMFHVLRRGLGAPRACDVVVSAQFNGLVLSGEIRLQLLQR